MKKYVALFLTLLLSAVCFGSCMLNPSDTEPENMIYNSKSELYIVVADSEFPSADVDRIFDFIASRKATIPTLTNVFEEGKHNIVIGRCSAPISVKAYERLAALGADEDDAAYLIYSDGSSLALAYQSDDYGFALDGLVEYFLEHLVDDVVAVAEGTVTSESFDAYDRVVADDEAMLEKKWAALASATSDELAESMRELYGIYGDGVIKWIAELYDPGVGGFYFSNSGRDNYGFLPDAESTSQALGFLNSSGIFASVGGKWSTALPADMLKQLGDFAYSLQDSDGYFYHPQWGKNIINSRRSRDLSHCVSILSALGRKPKYKTITGVGGDVDPVSYLSSGLGGSAVSAVSRVVAAADSGLIPDHLQSTTAFRNYINKLFDENHSYYAGHNLSSQSSEIKARGQEYIDIVIEVLNERQKSNGLWQDEINYLGVNGLMKISGVYNSMKAAIPNADKAASAALFAITTEEETTTIVQIWNAWEAADRVVNNVLSYGDSSIARSVRERLLSDAPQYLEATKDKVLAFRRDDFSFSYNVTGKTSGVSQSAAVSVSGTTEGDVNATTIAITSMISSIYSVMDIESHMVPLYTESDRIVLMRILSELSPLIKDAPALVEPDPESFDDLQVGDPASEAMNVTDSTNLGAASICADPRADKDGNVLKVSVPTVPADQGGDVIYINNNTSSLGVSCNVFETEMCVAEVNTASANIIELRMQGSATSKIAYHLYFYMSGSNVVIKERGYNGAFFDRDLCDFLTVGEWFKLRIEYYPGDHGTVRIKVRINDTLIAVSDNYYDANGDKLYGEGNPQTGLVNTRIFFNKTPVTTVYFDDVRCYQTDLVYSAESFEDPFGYNVDQPVEEERIYDFEEEISTDITVVGSAEIDGDGKLAMGSGDSVTVPATPRSLAPNCVSFSMSITVPEGSSGSALTFGAYDKNRTPAGIAEYRIKVKDGQLILAPVISGAEAAEIALSDAELGEEFRLSVDYYPAESTALIYLDGKLLVASGDVYADAAYRFFGQMRISASASVQVDDLSAARTEKSFSAATSTDAPEKKYDFESGKGDAVTDGSVVDREGGKALLLSDGRSLTLPVNERAVAKNTSRFIFDADLSECADGAGFTAYILDENEAAIFALRFVKQGGKIYVYELCEQGEFSAALSMIDVEKVSFSMNYYPAEGALVLLNGATPVVESGVTYSAATADSFGAYCSIVSDGDVYVDNAIAENLMAVKVECETTVAPSESDGRIGFETSGNSSIPSGVTLTLRSAGAVAGIKAMLRDEKMNKALVMKTNAGGIDLVEFKNTKPAASGTAYRFEADIRLEDADASSVWQLKLQSGAGNAYLLFINVSGNSISLTESSYENADETVGGTTYDRITLTHSDVATVGEWFTLTVEYIPSGNGVTVVIYVDGEQISESGLYYGSHIPSASAQSSVSGAALQSMKTKKSVLYVDNVLLEKFKP